MSLAITEHVFLLGECCKRFLSIAATEDVYCWRQDALEFTTAVSMPNDAKKTPKLDWERKEQIKA